MNGEMGDDAAFRARNWNTYWGGMGAALEPPMIHRKLLELRREVGGLAAKRSDSGPKFPIKSAKELFQKFAQALNDVGMIAPVVSQKVTLIETDSGTACHVEATVRLAAEDGSFIDVVGSGHGMDRDDKAGGKASTYAWKDAILKGLTIGEKDVIDSDDEEGVGAAVKPGKRAAEKPATKPAEKFDAPSAISACNTVDELKRLRDEKLKSLPEADQLAASVIWKARKAELEATGGN